MDGDLSEIMIFHKHAPVVPDNVNIPFLNLSGGQIPVARAVYVRFIKLLSVDKSDTIFDFNGFT